MGGVVFTICLCTLAKLISTLLTFQSTDFLTIIIFLNFFSIILLLLTPKTNENCLYLAFKSISTTDFIIFFWLFFYTCLCFFLSVFRKMFFQISFCWLSNFMASIITSLPECFCFNFPALGLFSFLDARPSFLPLIVCVSVDLPGCWLDLSTPPITPQGRKFSFHCPQRNRWFL